MMGCELMIRAHFTLAVEDYVEYRRLYLRSKRWLLYLRWVLFAVAAGISSVGVYFWWLDTRDWQAGLVLILFGCIVLIPSLTPIVKASLRQQFKKRPLLSEEVTLLADDARLCLETKSTKLELSWGAFSSLLESDTLFVLMIQGEGGGCIVPKRGFIASDAARFIELLRSKLPRRPNRGLSA